jgi:microcin C transport system substrate-binding protein
VDADGTHRIVYNAWRLAVHPSPMPPYAGGEDWAMTTWWAAPAAGKGEEN